MRFLAFSFFLFIFQSASAITPEQVVESSLSHFPKVIESVKNFEIEKNKLVEANGNFDGKIKGQMNSRTDGFYDGDAYEVSIEKPIPYFNSKVFGGRRQGFGQFPSYEGKYETLNQGEDFIGLSISLLRNSLIDKNRFNIRFLEQNKEQADINITRVKLNVQTMALKAYWTWYTKGQELKVYRDMLELASIRADKLNRRIKAGDLAEIYSIENSQYILKRQAQVSQKQMEFKEASFYLSLFYRNQNGDPVLLEENALPSEVDKNLTKIEDTSTILKKALNSNLELKQIHSQKEQAQLDIQYGQNEALPLLD